VPSERAPFGRLLKHHREAMALSQQALAEQAGLSLDAISALESGRRGGPRLESARRLAEALGLVGEERAVFLAAARPGEPMVPAKAAFAPAGRPTRTAPPAAAAAPARQMSSRPPLPRQVGALIGREREVATALRLVRQTALLTLVGPGGVGKTRLALHVAAEAGDHFADGVVFVPLAPISDPGLVATAIATALDIQEGGVRPLPTTLIAALQSQELLLVLDNFEQVVEAAVLVADLVAACPHLTVLVTSRTPLHLSVEQEFSVPPLAIPTLAEAAARQIATLRQIPAVALFVAQVQRTDPDFTLTVENAEAIAAICRRLDGLPLALELAAARIKILAPVALRARLDQSLDVLSGGARDRPARQQTLHKTIAWSYGLLSTTEQALFARLSVFVGGWSLAAVAAVCGRAGESDSLDGLAALVDHSLVRPDGEAGESAEDARFSLLETVREFARDQLVARGEADELSRRHALYFTTRAEEVVLAPRPEEPEWSERLERDTENQRVALGWCAAQAEAGEAEATEWGLRLVDSLCLHWMARGRGREIKHALLQLLSRPEGAAYPRLRARALVLAGHTVGFAGSFAQARALLDEGLTLARASGESWLVAWALVFLGMGRTDPVQRQADLEEAVALERSAGVLVYLGAHYLDVGDVPRARALVEEAHTLAVAQGDRYWTHNALDVLGQIARAEGDTEAARQLFEESLVLRRVRRDKASIGAILRYLGEIAEEQGATDQARAYYGEALSALRNGWDVNRIIAILRGVAALALQAGNAERALRLAGTVNAVQMTIDPRIWMDIAPQQKLWARTSWADIQEATCRVLGPAEAAAAWAAGQAMSLDGAIADALIEVG
jgi:predicted ATPase/transcriptional regulator with XRE-family HTH domain